MSSVGRWIHHYLGGPKAGLMEDLYLNAEQLSAHAITVKISEIDNNGQPTLANLCRAGPSTMRVLFQAAVETWVGHKYITAKVYIRQ